MVWLLGLKYYMRKKIIRKRSYDFELKKCLFCAERKEVDHKDAETLRRFISPYGRILPARKTGLCTKHQRQLTKATKRARFLALLPYTIK